MNDQHIIACATIFQDVLLLINAVLIAWYLWETHGLRLAGDKQVKATAQQFAMAQEQLEAQIRPALTMSGGAATLLVVNVGSGPALNLQLAKGKNQAVLPASFKIETNFGMRVKGSCVAPGGSQAKDTNESVGSWGQLVGEDVQLVYESLSGKRYASIIEFAGGNPCKTRLYVP